MNEPVIKVSKAKFVQSDDEKKYSEETLEKMRKKGAKSFYTMLVEVPYKNGGETIQVVVQALIGIDANGKLMNGPNDLLALPCPPFCPKGGNGLTDPKS